jgi:hypothetical protein
VMPSSRGPPLALASTLPSMWPSNVPAPMRRCRPRGCQRTWRRLSPSRIPLVARTRQGYGLPTATRYRGDAPDLAFAVAVSRSDLEGLNHCLGDQRHDLLLEHRAWSRKPTGRGDLHSRP